MWKEGPPRLGAIQVTEHGLGLEEVGHSGAVGLRGEEDDLLTDVVAALETVDESTDDRLIHDRVDRSGVTVGDERDPHQMGSWRR